MSMFAFDPKSKVDLDVFTREFSIFEQDYVNEQQENACGKEETESLRRQLGEEQDRQRQLQEDVRSAEKTVATLQQALDNRCDAEDKSRKLLKEVERLKSCIDSQKKDMELEISRHEKVKLELEEKHRNELDQLKKELHEQAEREMKEWRRITEAQEQTTEQLKRRITALEKDKAAELVKQRLEYDLKVMKLHKEKSQAAQAVSSAASHEKELYKKKLQQARTESQREISELKATISSLRQQLAFYEQPPPRPPTGRSARFTNR